MTEEEVRLLILYHSLDIYQQTVFLAQTELPIGTAVYCQVTHLLACQEELRVHIEVQQLTLCTSQLSTY